jgi:hypothetical protein
MTEFLFNTTLLTDMGCTLRLFRREALDLIRPRLTIGGSHFGPQLLLEVIAHGIPFVEIPVNYRTRVGVSSVTGDIRKAVRLGLRMIALVLEYRVKLFRATRPLWREAAPATRDLEALARLSGERGLSHRNSRDMNDLRSDAPEQQSGEDAAVGVTSHQSDIRER